MQPKEKEILFNIYIDIIQQFIAPFIERQIYAGEEYYELAFNKHLDFQTRHKIGDPFASGYLPKLYSPISNIWDIAVRLSPLQLKAVILRLGLKL